MVKEQGHEGGAVAPVKSATMLLADILDILKSQVETTMPADELTAHDFQIGAGAGDLYIPSDVQFGYVYIPSAPRALTLYAGMRGAYLGSFAAGASINLKLPRQDGLTLVYGAGSGTYVTVWLSARPVEINNGSIVSGTGAFDLGKAEDSAHVSGDVGVELLGVRNDSNASTFSGANGDYTPISLTGTGAVHATVLSTTAATDGSASAAQLFKGGAIAQVVYAAALNNAFNGVTTDRWRNNVDLTILASAARTVTTQSAAQTNHNGRGIDLWFDITAVPGIETVTLTVEVQDPISGVWSQIFAGVAEAAIATKHYRIYPGETLAANVAVSVALARTFRVVVTHSGVSSFTYSVGGCVIL